MRRGTVRTFQTEEMRASCDRPSQIGLVKVGLYGVHNWMDLQDVSHSTMQGMLGLIFGLKSASFVTIQCLDEI